MGRLIDCDNAYNAIQITSDKFGVASMVVFRTVSNMLSRIPTEDAIRIPENATNGDMVLATGMFSVVKELNDGIMVYVKPKGVFGQVLEYNKDWWDAPFKESEEKKSGRNV